MDIEVSSEVVEAVLELIGNLAEDGKSASSNIAKILPTFSSILILHLKFHFLDIVKYQLATTSLCDKLLKFLKTSQTTPDDESLNVTKVACDLIVLMLTGGMCK